MSVSNALQIPSNTFSKVGSSLPKSKGEILLDNVRKQKDCGYLIPAIGSLALGIIFAPTAVLTGIAAGIIGYGVKIVYLVMTDPAFKKSEKNPIKFSQDDHDKNINIITETLVLPVLEEGIFRGIIQPLAMQGILFITPAASVAFLGTGLSIAAVVAIVATGVIFGVLHLSNKHADTRRQAIATSVDGIIWGILSVQFGLFAAVASHIMNNTCATVLTNAFTKREDFIQSIRAPYKK